MPKQTKIYRRNMNEKLQKPTETDRNRQKLTKTDINGLDQTRRYRNRHQRT